ncbi:unnamed protein product [Trichobilharzia regenti]|nr:unnamed protein product [Trichobilharzia regenti]
MRICSKVLVSEWDACQRVVGKPKESSVLFYKDEDIVYVNISYVSSNISRRYKISANIEKLFIGHVKDGSLTIRLKNPAKDIMLQKIQSCSHHRLRITRREDYPFSQGFSASLQELCVKELRLRQFDTRMLKLSCLRSLDLSKNYLERIPQEIQDLNLVQLYLNNNLLASWPSIPENSALSKSLEYINLAHNLLVWLPDDFWLLSKLRNVDLSTNLLRGIPTAYLHKLQFLVILTLYSNQLDSLPLVLTIHRLNELSVHGNTFLPSETEVKPSKVAPSLLDCASLAFVRSNWYPCLEKCLPWKLRVRLAVFRKCLRCRLSCGIEPYRILVPYNSWRNISSDRMNPPSVLTYLCSDECVRAYNLNKWKYTLD